MAVKIISTENGRSFNGVPMLTVSKITINQGDKFRIDEVDTIIGKKLLLFINNKEMGFISKETSEKMKQAALNKILM